MEPCVPFPTAARAGRTTRPGVCKDRAADRPDVRAATELSVLRAPIIGATLPYLPLDGVGFRFQITQIFPGYRVHFLRLRSRTLLCLASVELHEVVDPDQPKAHPPTTRWTHFIAWRLVITDKDLGCPAETRLASKVCQPCAEPGDHRCLRNEKLITLMQALRRSCRGKPGLRGRKMERGSGP